MGLAAAASVNTRKLFRVTHVAAGASVNTFGIRGVKEYCYFLKQVTCRHPPSARLVHGEKLVS